VVQKELLVLAHSCGERYSLQAAEVLKGQFGLGFSALMPYGAHPLNFHIEQGLPGGQLSFDLDQLQIARCLEIAIKVYKYLAGGWGVYNTASSTCHRAGFSTVVLKVSKAW
jgi:hypothetical protein